MNRYAARGITEDAHYDGLRVAVLADSARGARAAFKEVTAHATTATNIRRTNGAERIEFLSGGTITFHRSVDSLRGVSADIIYFDGHAEHQVHEHDQWDTLRAVIATSPHPQIIRA